jgi:hypothetical protein
MSSWWRTFGVFALLVSMTVGFGVGASAGLPLASATNASHAAGFSVSEGAQPAVGWSVSELKASAPVAAPYDEPGLGLSGARYLGAPMLRTPANPTGSIDILVSLAFSNESRLNLFLAELSDPTSPEYHHYLTANQFDEQYGASSAVYNSLVAYFSSFGVAGLTTHPDRLALSFEATPTQAASIFHTWLGAYVSAQGLPFYAPAAAPLVPSLLAPYLVDVEGLSNYSEYQNHLAPIASFEALPSALAGDAATNGAIPAVSPISPHETPLSPGGASNPFASTTVTSNGLTNTYDQPVVLNLKGKTGTCDTNDCGDFVQGSDLQVAYNETGVLQKYGYPVNATVAAVLWSDTTCHADTGTCSSDGYYNYYCSTLTSGSAAWDFYMPDVTSFWKYSIPAGEPMPRAVSMPITGYTYAYPTGSNGYSASCDDAEAEGENTLDVDMLGSMAPGANVFQVFGGSSSSTAIDSVVADILSPTTAEFSSTGPFDTAANVKDLTNVSVISNSWTTSGTLPAAFTTDLKTAQARGITVLGATGDSGTTLAPPAEIGANTYGTVAVGGTTAAINTTTLLRGAPHLASASAPYYGVGRGEIGWYEPSGKVDGFTSTYGGTGGVASSTTYYRASWFNASSDAQGVANAVRTGNYRAEPDVAAIANDTIVDLDAGPYSLNFTCWISTACTAISSMAVGTTSGSAPTVGGTYFIGTSISTQVVGGEIATIDHALYAQHQGWLGFLDPAVYPMGQKQYQSDLTLKSFYDVTTYTDAGGLTAAYEAKVGYDLATGWGIIDAGNFTRNMLTYPITFTETGLPSGTHWSITLTPQLGDASCTISGSVCTNAVTSSSTTTTIVFNDAFGSFTYKVNLVAGYAPVPTSGTVVQHGAAVGVGVTFSQVTYAVSFTESGLSSGTLWTVTLNGNPQSSTGPTISFTEPNGTFGYSVGGIAGYKASPSSGSVTVSGATVSTGIAFSQRLYTVAFSESGLPSGQSFTVTLGGVPQSLTTTGGTDTLSFSVPNGTYGYTISGIAGYSQSTLSSTGSVTVNGAPVSEPTLAYTEVTYPVTFTESGLPGGTSWTVTLNGGPESSTGASIGFSEPNGSFGFTTGGVAGYTAAPNTGSVTVNGGSASVAIVFTQVTYPVTFSESGLPAGETFEVTLNSVPESITTDGGTDSLLFTVPNGTDTYTIAAVSGFSQSTLPSSGSVIVSGAAVTEPTLVYGQLTYSVTFTQAGLPAGTLWSVTLNGDTESSTGTSISFFEPSGTYDYSVGGVAGYTAAPNSGSVVVSGGAVSTAITFTQVTYTVTFTESGLSGGTSWSVTLNGDTESTTGSSIQFTEPNGTFGFTVATVPGYQAEPNSGSVVVNGADTSTAIDFTPDTYPVTFTESGLPSGTLWSVTLNGDTESSMGTSISFTEPNGGYDYTIGGIAGYTAAPNSGSAEVSGAAVSTEILFTQVTYSVTFTEGGLPGGTLWSVTLNGDTESSTAATIVFTEPNGTFGYTVGGVAGYTAAPTTGSVGVNGADASASIVFTQVTYTVTFTESGLPGGTWWTVTLNGDAESSTSASIQFTEPNGSYGYTVSGVAGYHASPHSGSVTVSGTDVSVAIGFSQVTYTVTFTEGGLPSGTLWTVTLNGDTVSAEAASIQFEEPNATYGFTVGGVAGYRASPNAGSVTVDGADTSVGIAFTQVTYSVTFTESGLPAGETFRVTLNGAHQSLTTNGGADSLTFTEPNGTYAYSLTVVAGFEQSTLPFSGNVVVNGAGVDEPTLVYSSVTYPVTFSESGLPSGTMWSVTLEGYPSDSSTGTTIVIQATNGSYGFSIGAVTGFVAHPGTGFVDMIGGAVAAPILFVPVTLFAVSFTEVGLPSGTTWTVTVGASTASSDLNTIVFYLPNGTYSFTVGNVGGFSPTPHSGSVVVNGAPVSVPVGFTRGTYLVTFAETGLPSGKEWSVALGGDLETGSGTTIAFFEPNGTYTYLVQSEGAFRVTNIVPEGSVTVNGAAFTQPVMFAHGTTFAIKFHEKGLGSGTSWCVALGSTVCSTAPTIAFLHLTPGTYSYSVGSVGALTTIVKLGTAVVPASGSTTLVHSETFQVRYAYAATFTESGLASGTAWKVSAGGSSVTSTTTSIVLYLINGTYTYSVGHVNGYVVSHASGRLVLAGAAVGVSVTYSPVPGPLPPTGSTLSVAVRDLERAINFARAL